MDAKISFRFFYGNEAESFSFYRIPKTLFRNNFMKTLTSDAKILYGLMLDRMSLSIKNQWFDAENRAYIYFSIEDIMKYLNCGRNKAVKVLQELEEIGLIDKRRQGLGKVSIIYVKSFVVEECGEKNHGDQEGQRNMESANCNDVVSTEVAEINFSESQNKTSRSNETILPEVSTENSNYNNMSYTNGKKESNLIRSDKGTEDYDVTRELYDYQELIKNNIDYDGLIHTHKYDEGIIQGIYDLILETVLSTHKTILIAKEWYPTELVRKKFLMLNYSHIEYVLYCFNHITGKIRNIKQYLLAALFNAPSTMHGYYQAKANHDMPELVM